MSLCVKYGNLKLEFVNSENPNSEISDLEFLILNNKDFYNYKHFEDYVKHILFRIVNKCISSKLNKTVIEDIVEDVLIEEELLFEDRFFNTNPIHAKLGLYGNQHIIVCDNKI